MRHSRFALLFILVALVATTAAAEPSAAVRKLAGAWMVVTTISPSQFTDDVAVVFPEMISYTTDGTVLGSSALASFSVDVDGEEIPVQATAGHSNCRKIGRKRFATTQIRFFNSLVDGAFLGYLKITTDFTLQNRQQAHGIFRTEVLQPDLSPYLADGVPIVLDGVFEMARMPVERLR